EKPCWSSHAAREKESCCGPPDWIRRSRSGWCGFVARAFSSGLRRRAASPFFVPNSAPHPGPVVSPMPSGESVMRTAQQGDRVQIHYVKRFQDGSVVSSHGRTPLEVVVGTDHPRLPGLGLALVGLAPGTSTRLNVAPEHAYGSS